MIQNNLLINTMTEPDTNRKNKNTVRGKKMIKAKFTKKINPNKTPTISIEIGDKSKSKKNIRKITKPKRVHINKSTKTTVSSKDQQKKYKMREKGKVSHSKIQSLATNASIKSTKTVLSTKPKRTVLLKDRAKEPSSTVEVSKTKYKRVQLDSTNLLNTLMGELLMNTLVRESNKSLHGKSTKKSRVKYPEYNSEEDSDYILDSNLEEFPSDIEYTEEEEMYLSKLNQSDRNDLIVREILLNESKKREVPLRFKILNMDSISQQNKCNIIDKLDNLYNLDQGDNEYHKLATWVNWLEKVPFGVIKSLPVTNKSSPVKIGQFLKNAKENLDSAVFGHTDAKEKILTVLTKQISNPNGEGCCIAIQGPPGNGKTTLVKEGICKALGRPFAFIALGGMQDSSFMTGHEYTYEGSKPGRILEILSETACMNPVIYFDELDKISKSPQGDEIANLLCHLTDTSQNNEFHDKYMSGIDFDLSKAIFIFSYNNEADINPILLDRLFRIKTLGLDVKSKLIIAKDYLLPNLLKEYNIKEGDIKFEDECVDTLINNYTNKEKGVRNLKRCLETVVSKVNVLQYLIAAENKVETPLYGDAIIRVSKNPKKRRMVTRTSKAKIQKPKRIKGKTKLPLKNKSSKKSKTNKQIYTEYGRDVHDLSGSELDDFVDRKLEDVKNDQEKYDNKIKKYNLVKKYKSSKTKKSLEQTPVILKPTYEGGVKVSDIVSFNLKNFKFPMVITNEIVKKFIKKDTSNTSIEHMYL